MIKYYISEYFWFYRIVWLVALIIYICSFVQTGLLRVLFVTLTMERICNYFYTEQSLLNIPTVLACFLGVFFIPDLSRTLLASHKQNSYSCGYMTGVTGTGLWFSNLTIGPKPPTSPLCADDFRRFTASPHTSIHTLHSNKLQLWPTSLREEKQNIWICLLFRRPIMNLKAKCLRELETIRSGD